MSLIRELLLKILLQKEVQVMAVVYATLIVKGKKTLEQVPALIREDVRQILVDLEVNVEGRWERWGGLRPSPLFCMNSERGDLI